MTPRLERLLARTRERRGSFWQRRVWAAESWAQSEGRPASVRQAMILERVLANVEAVVAADELIVGAHPALPLPDLAPPGVPLCPDPDTRRSDAQRRAMRAGLFTSSIKTGHLTPDYPLLLTEGYGGVLRRVEARRAEAPPEHASELEAMEIGLRAASAFVLRHSVRARELGADERDRSRREELSTIASACQRVATAPPRTLHEALQLLWLTFLIQCVENGESSGAFALGRFDQYLYPFWRSSLESGCSRASLLELVACVWIKLNEFGRLGLAARVLNLTLGGSDDAGRDCANDLSTGCLEVMDWLRSTTPSLSVRWHAGMDPEFFDRAIRLSTQGFGQPAFYGDPAVKEAMVSAGVDPVDAADAVPGGCVEQGVQGCCNPWVGNFFSLPKCLELALHNGVDPQSGERIGPATGRPDELDTFDRLFAAYQEQVDHGVALMAESENICDQIAAEYVPYPFLSTLVGDCIERGRDITAGGARYNFTEDQGVGIAHVVDSLLNLQRLVYEQQEIGLAELVETLDKNFEGEEPLRNRLRVLRPSYGDGSAEAAALARRVVHGFFRSVERFTNPRGGPHRPGLLVWTLYHDWADRVGALPDGRRRGDALVSSIGPRQEARIESPTSVVLGTTAFDHWHCAGGLTLNLRFARQAIAENGGLEALAGLLRTYFERGGMQVQINVTDSGLLRAAQARPVDHADLVVRVSGFAARFVDLDPLMQNEIIAREELVADQ